MNELELKNEISKLGNDINAKIEKANSQALEAGKVGAEVKAQLTDQVQKFEALSKQLDSIEATQKRSVISGAETKESISSILADNAEYKNYVVNKGRMSFEVKATLLKPAVGASSIIQPQVNSGLIIAPNKKITMRDLVSTATTTSDTIRNFYEDYYTGNSAFVAEGSLKPEDDFKLKSDDVAVRTLATTIRVSNQMLADMPFIQNYIQVRGTAKQEQMLNRQMLYGSGQNEDLVGITTKAKAFVKTAGLNTIANATIYDILFASQVQVDFNEYSADAVVLNPVTVANLALQKNPTTGAYLFPELHSLNTVKTINGMTVVEDKAMGADEFLVGDFKLGATLYQREAIKIELFDQDRDNVARNLTTIRIEQRMGLVTEVPAVFVYGTFTAAKAALGV